MDEGERNLPEREIAQNRRSANRSTLVSGLSVLVAAGAIVWSVGSTAARPTPCLTGTLRQLTAGLSHVSAIRPTREALRTRWTRE